MIDISEEEKVRILPSDSNRRWVSDQYLNIFMAKYSSSIFKISSKDSEVDSTDSNASKTDQVKKNLNLTPTEISNIVRKVQECVPGQKINFSSLVVVDSEFDICKYLLGQKADTLIISKVRNLNFESHTRLELAG